MAGDEHLKRLVFTILLKKKKNVYSYTNLPGAAQFAHNPFVCYYTITIISTLERVC